MKEYDIVVVGAGSGGITAAVTAAGFGKKVLLIDKNKPGGECTWAGCVPSKALINEAKKVQIVKKRVKDFSYDSKDALDHVHAVRERIYSHEDPQALSRSGIAYKQGLGTFKDAKTLMVGDEEIRAKRFILSTGSSPFVPPIEGLDQVPYLTNETIFEGERLPRSLIILGGGPIGLELAQAANRLGTKVELVEMMPQLIFREEQDFSRIIEKKLVDEGVLVHTGTKATSVRSEGEQIVLSGEKGGGSVEIRGDALLVAIGRKPNLDGLGLDAAGIRYDRRGIAVNARMQTNRSHIYAIGDVAGPYQFSHMANAQGIVATQNAILPFKKKIRYDHIAWVTFTEPEIARAGMTEEEARKAYGKKIRVYEFDFNQLDRAMTAGESIEKMKVVLDKKGRTLGVSVLADRAGELIGEAQVLKTAGLNFAKMGGIIHPYPTYGEVFSKIGKKVMVDNILGHPLVKLFRKS